MLVLLEYYFIPFMHWLFFAVTPMIWLLAAFVFKRGVRQGRETLRKRSFWLIYIAILKLFLWDNSFYAVNLFCKEAEAVCNITMFRAVSFIFMLPVLYTVHMFYKKFIHMVSLAKGSAREMWIRFWANLSMLIVLLLTVWLVSPWVSYLIFGHAPSYLLNPVWKIVVMSCYIIIFVTFWKYEDCSVIPKTKEDKHYNMKAWMPRDTLWLALALLAITHSFLIISVDFLSNN